MIPNLTCAIYNYFTSCLNYMYVKWLDVNVCYRCFGADFPRIGEDFQYVGDVQQGCMDRIHYNDVIMSAMASQITSLLIIYSTVYLGADQRKHQSSASLAFVRGIHRWPAQRASNAENFHIFKSKIWLVLHFLRNCQQPKWRWVRIHWYI